MLDGAKFVCLHENGEPYRTIEAKGRKLTIGYLMDCDHIIENAEAEKIHCQIECDAFGHVTIYNKSNKNPISVNGERVMMKRTLFNNSKITILDKEYLWQYKNSTATENTEGMSTPIKQIGIPEQPPSSCPALKYHLEIPQRFTMHNLRAYRVDSATNLTMEMDESSSQEESPPAEHVTFELDSTPAKIDLVDSTKDKTTSSTEKRLREIRNSFGFSGMATTSYSPRETGVRTEKTFIAIIPPKTPRGTLCRTPKGLLESIHLHGERNDTMNNSELLSFATPTKKYDGQNRSEIIVQHARSAMKIIDLTTPSKLLTRNISNKKPPTGKSLLSDKKDTKSNSTLQATPKMQLNTDTPTSTASVITVDSSIASDSSEITEDVSAVTSTTPLRSQLPISSVLRKQVLLASAKKHVSMKTTPHPQKTSANLSLPELKVGTPAAAAKPSIKSCLKSESLKDSKSDGIAKKNVARRLDILSTEQPVTPLKTQEIQLNESTSVTATSTPYKTQSIEEQNDSIQQDTGIELLSLLHSSNDVEPLNTTTLPEETKKTLGENDDLLKEIEEILNTSDELKKQLKSEINSNEPTSSSSSTETTTSHSPPKPTATSPEKKTIVNKTPAKNSITASIILKAISSIEKGNRESQKEDEEKENKINDCAGNPTTPAAHRRISLSAASPSVVVATATSTTTTVATATVNEENCIGTVTPLTQKRVSKRKSSLSVENEDSLVVNKSSHHIIDEFNTENMGAIVEEDTDLDSQNGQTSKVTPIKMTTQDELDKSSIPETPMHQFKELKVIKKAVNTPNEPMEDDIISLLHCSDESFAESVIIEEQQESKDEDKTIAVLPNEPKEEDVMIESKILQCNATVHQIGKEQTEEGNTSMDGESALDQSSFNQEKSDDVEETLNECFAFEILDTSLSEMPEKVQTTFEGKVSPQLFDEETADRVEGIDQQEDRNTVQEHNLNKTFEILVNESDSVASIETETDDKNSLSTIEKCKSNDDLILENKNASKSNIAEEKTSTFTENAESEELQNKEEAEILFEDEHLTLTEADEIEEPSIIAVDEEQSTFKNSNEKSENEKMTKEVPLDENDETKKAVDSSENTNKDISIEQEEPQVKESNSLMPGEDNDKNIEIIENPKTIDQKSTDEEICCLDKEKISSENAHKPNEDSMKTLGIKENILEDEVKKVEDSENSINDELSGMEERLAFNEKINSKEEETQADMENYNSERLSEFDELNAIEECLALDDSIESINEQMNSKNEIITQTKDDNNPIEEASAEEKTNEDHFETSNIETRNIGKILEEEQIDINISKQEEEKVEISEGISIESDTVEEIKENNEGDSTNVETTGKKSIEKKEETIETISEILVADIDDVTAKKEETSIPIKLDNIEEILELNTEEAENLSNSVETNKSKDEDEGETEKDEVLPSNEDKSLQKPEETIDSTIENLPTLSNSPSDDKDVKENNDGDSNVETTEKKAIEKKEETIDTTSEILVAAIDDVTEKNEESSISIKLDDIEEIVELNTEEAENLSNSVETYKSKDEGERETESDEVPSSSEDKSLQKPEETIDSKSENLPTLSNSPSDDKEANEVKENNNADSTNVETTENKAIQKSEETSETASEILVAAIDDVTEKKEEISIAITLNDIEEIIQSNTEEIQSMENSNSVETNKPKGDDEGEGEIERDDKSLQKAEETIDSNSENCPTLSISSPDDNEILLLDESLEVSITAIVHDENQKAAFNIAPSKLNDLEEIVEQNKEELERVEPEAIDEEQIVGKEREVEIVGEKDNQANAMHDIKEDVGKPSSSDVAGNLLKQSDEVGVNIEISGTTKSVEFIDQHGLVSASDIIQQVKSPKIEIIDLNDSQVSLNEKNNEVSLGSGETEEEQEQPLQDDKKEAETKKKSLEEVEVSKDDHQEITTLPKVYQEGDHDKEVASDTSANLDRIQNDQNLKDQDEEACEMKATTHGKSFDDKVPHTNEDDGQKKEGTGEEVTTTTISPIQPMKNLLEVTGDDLDSMKSFDALDDKDQSGDTKSDGKGKNITQETIKTPEDTSEDQSEILKSSNKLDQNEETTDDEIPTRSDDTQRNVVQSLEFSVEDTKKEDVNQGDSQTLSVTKVINQVDNSSEDHDDIAKEEYIAESSSLKEKEESGAILEKNRTNDKNISNPTVKEVAESLESVSESSKIEMKDEKICSERKIPDEIEGEENKETQILDSSPNDEISNKKINKTSNSPKDEKGTSDASEKQAHNDENEETPKMAEKAEVQEKKSRHARKDQFVDATTLPEELKKVDEISEAHATHPTETKEETNDMKIQNEIEKTKGQIEDESKKSDQISCGTSEKKEQKPRRLRQARTKASEVENKQEQKFAKANESSAKEVDEEAEKKDDHSEAVKPEIETKRSRRIRQVRVNSVDIEKDEEQKKIEGEEAKLEDVEETAEKEDDHSEPKKMEIETKKPRRMRQVRAKSISVDKEEEPKKEEVEESKLEEIDEAVEKEDDHSDAKKIEIDTKKPRRMRQVRAKSISVDKEEEPKKEDVEESKLEEIDEAVEKEDDHSDAKKNEIETKKPRRMRQVRAKSISVDKEEEPKKEDVEESKLEEIDEAVENEDDRSDTKKTEIETKKPRRMRQVGAKSISVDKEEEPKKEEVDESKLEEIDEAVENEDDHSDAKKTEIETKKPRRMRQVRAKSISIDKEEEPKKEEVEESKLEEIDEAVEKEDDHSDAKKIEIETKKPRRMRQVRAKSISVDKEEEPKKEKLEESKLEGVIEDTEREDQKFTSDDHSEEAVVETETKSKNASTKQKSMKVQTTRNVKQARSTKKKPKEEESIENKEEESVKNKEEEEKEKEEVKEENIREAKTQKESKNRPKNEQTNREDENELAKEAQITKVVKKEEDNEEHHKTLDITQTHNEKILDTSTQQRSLRRRPAVHSYEISSDSDNETQQTPQSRKRRIGKANQKLAKTNAETKEEIDTTAANTSKATIQRGGRKKQLTITNNEEEKPTESEDAEIPKKRARKKAEPKSSSVPVVTEQLLHDTIESKDPTTSEVEEAAAKVQKGRKPAVRGRAASKHEDEKPKGKQNKIEKETIIKEVENNEKESKAEPEPEIEAVVRPSSRRGAKKIVTPAENITEVSDLTETTTTTPKRTAARKAKIAKVQDEAFLYEEPGKKRGRAKKTAANVEVEGKEEAKTSTVDNDDAAPHQEEEKEEEVQPKSIAKRKGKTTKEDTTAGQKEVPIKRSRRQSVQSEVQQEDTAPIEIAADNKTQKPSVEHVEEKKKLETTTRTGRQRKLTESENGAESNIIEKRRKLPEDADDLVEVESSVITKKPTRGRSAKQKDTTTDGVVAVTATSRRKQTKAQKANTTDSEMMAGETEKTLTVPEDAPAVDAVDNTKHTHPDEEIATKRGRGRQAQKQVNTPARGVVTAESTKTPTQRSQRRKHVHFDEATPVHVTADEDNEEMQYENKEIAEEATSSTSRSKRRRK